MLQTIINAWKIADLRKKILFTALIIFIFRLGAAIPVPFTNIIVDASSWLSVNKGILDGAAEGTCVPDCRCGCGI